MNHKRLLFALPFVLMAGVACAAWPRLGQTAAPVFSNTGSSAIAFSVSLTSGTAKLVYSGADDDREIFFQNTSDTYNVHCGTFSAVNAKTGTNRWMIRKSQDITTNGTYNVYCVVEDSAGTNAVEVIGVIEYDAKDIR